MHCVSGQQRLWGVSADAHARLNIGWSTIWLVPKLYELAQICSWKKISKTEFRYLSIWYQLCSQNAEKATRIKGRLLDQAVVLFNCTPFQNGNISQRKKIAPSGSELFPLWYGKSVYHSWWPPLNITIFITHMRNCVMGATPMETVCFVPDTMLLKMFDVIKVSLNKRPILGFGTLSL